MKLAVMKAEGHIPGGGYHYMLHPIALKDDFEADVFKMIGYVILEVTDADGEKLLKEAREALMHQCQVAVLTEKAIDNKSK